MSLSPMFPANPCSGSSRRAAARGCRARSVRRGSYRTNTCSGAPLTPRLAPYVARSTWFVLRCCSIPRPTTGPWSSTGPTSPSRRARSCRYRSRTLRTGLRSGWCARARARVRFPSVRSIACPLWARHRRRSVHDRMAAAWTPRCGGQASTRLIAEAGRLAAAPPAPGPEGAPAIRAVTFLIGSVSSG